MKKILLLFHLMLLISASLAMAADLSKYPSPFISGSSFDAQIIVGSSSPATDTLAASDIAVALQQVSEDRITAVLEDEYDSSKNSILVGLPCHNPVLASVLGTTACDFGLPNGSGYLKIVEKNGLTSLIVSGKTAADTRKAARALADYRKYGLMGEEVLITGTLDELLVQKLQVPIEVKAGSTAPAVLTSQGIKTACDSDADCADDRWCLAGTCRELGCPEGTVAKSHDCVKEAKPAATTAAANETPKAAGTPVKVEKKGFFARIFGWFGSIFSRKKAE